MLPVLKYKGESGEQKTTKPKSKRKHNKKGKKAGGEAVVKLPKTIAEASNNWKLLLAQKSAEIAKKKEASAGQSGKLQYLRRDIQKHKKRLMEKGNSSDLSTKDDKISKDEGVRKKDMPKLTNLNSLGYFDYTHYGHLKTVTTSRHEFLTKSTPAVAIDCEMVGVGPLKQDALARVSIVNEFGYCLYDKFVKPKLAVADYRTEFSGVREEDLKNAEEFSTVINSVAEIIKGKILVGHSLKSDFDVLLLKHPKMKIRDTSFYYRRKFKKLKTPSLKVLVKDHLKVEIQSGEHNSITDAQAAMKLYLIAREEWETSMSEKYNVGHRKYWRSPEFRKAFQAIGFQIQWDAKKTNE